MPIYPRLKIYSMRIKSIKSVSLPISAVSLRVDDSITNALGIAAYCTNALFFLRCNGQVHGEIDTAQADLSSAGGRMSLDRK